MRQSRARSPGAGRRQPALYLTILTPSTKSIWHMAYGILPEPTGDKGKDAFGNEAIPRSDEACARPRRAQRRPNGRRDGLRLRLPDAVRFEPGLSADHYEEASSEIDHL